MNKLAHDSMERFFADCYFNKSLKTLVHDGHNPVVMYQVFQRKDAIFAGIPYIEKFFVSEPVELWALPEGSYVKPYEPVATIKGPVQSIIAYETEYLGCLARCIRAATNTHNAVVAARGKPFAFFPARFDVPEAQVYDGYGAEIGGATACATAAQMEGFNLSRTINKSEPPLLPIGTMPHALIAAYGGNTVLASLAYAKAMPGENCWPLVDFENDCARTAVEVFRTFQAQNLQLAGVRLDTSDKLVDAWINDICESNKQREKEFHGVNIHLVRHVRRELDRAGATDVKIAVSGGFTAEKIAAFEAQCAPVDMYAAGESMISGSFACTSDIVGYYPDGSEMVHCAKTGRGFKQSDKLRRIL